MEIYASQKMREETLSLEGRTKCRRKESQEEMIQWAISLGSYLCDPALPPDCFNVKRFLRTTLYLCTHIS